MPNVQLAPLLTRPLREIAPAAQRAQLAEGVSVAGWLDGAEGRAVRSWHAFAR